MKRGKFEISFIAQDVYYLTPIDDIAEALLKKYSPKCSHIRMQFPQRIQKMQIGDTLTLDEAYFWPYSYVYLQLPEP